MALTTPSVSPAIVVKEIDLTGVAPNVETSLSGMVGDFNWGPVDVPTRVQDEGQLAEVFGTPNDGNAVDYFSAAQYLRYSGNLIVNRAIKQSYNAHSGLPSQSILVKSRIDYEQQESTFEGQTDLQWVSKYPGKLGNSIAVSVFASESDQTANETNWDAWPYREQFDSRPGTSAWADKFNASNDEIHIAVIDVDGEISGTPGSVLETFAYVSVALGAKTVDNGDNYVRGVVNSGSNYIWFAGWWDNQPTGGETGSGFTGIKGNYWGQAPNITNADDYGQGVLMTNPTGSTEVINPAATQSLRGGQDSLALGSAEFNSAFENFENKDLVDVQILIAPGMTTKSEQVSVVTTLEAIARGTRRDCVVVTSPDRTAAVGNVSAVSSVIETADELPASSYLIVDSAYLRVYNKYADNYIYVPAASSTAGLLALTDANYGPWYSPAGERRGQYLGSTGVSYSPNKADRDELYKSNVNPIVQFSGRGMLLFGDKTKQARPGAFDRINVRRLFLAVEKSVSISARNFMFEFNDEFTRSEFVAIVEPLLREIQARRGIEEFYVQCDARNNTEEVRARNELVASVFIKPAYAINFITLNFVATRAGLDFEEVIGTLS